MVIYSFLFLFFGLFLLHVFLSDKIDTKNTPPVPAFYKTTPHWGPKSFLIKPAPKDVATPLRQ